MWFWTLALSLGAGVAAYRWTLARERRQRGVPVWGLAGRRRAGRGRGVASGAGWCRCASRAGWC